MKTNLAKFINMVLSVRLKWDSISVHLLFLHHLIPFLLMPHRMGGQHAKKIPIAFKAYFAENENICHHLGYNGTFFQVFQSLIILFF